MRARTVRRASAVAILAVALCVAACEASVSIGTNTTYTNTDYGFSITYPKDYKQGTLADMASQAGAGAAFNVAFVDETGTEAGGNKIDGIIVSVYELKVEVTPDLMPAFKDELKATLKQIQSSRPDLRAGPLQDTTVNGIPGYKFEFTLDKDRVPLKSVTYVLVRGKREYQVTAQAAEQDWSARSTDLQKAIDSFQLL